MLPRGGVAYLLQKKSNQRNAGTSRKKAYCFLPLPLETNLPVHVNGHFALDHEARRNLWKDETTGYRSDWNNALLTDVIASCYLTLLDEARSHIHLPVEHNTEQDMLNGSKDVLVRKIQEYEKLFPLFLSGDTYWTTLVTSVYQGMDKKSLRLLPVLRSIPSKGTTPAVQLTWLPPTGEGKTKAFFNNLGISGCFAWPQRDALFRSEIDFQKEVTRRTEQKTCFEEILLQTGFNLLTFSLSVYEALQNSKVNSCCVSPCSVLEFYKTLNKEHPLCLMTSTPVEVGETPFKTTDGVTLVLKYCKDYEHFLANLSGLPLLLTQDNRLQEFSTSHPKFLSRHYGILPHCAEMFVNDHLRVRIFGDASSRMSPVFKHLGVQEFASNLSRTLPPLEYFCKDGYVSWCPTQQSEPNGHWICSVWAFLNEATGDVFKDTKLCDKEKTRRIHAILEPLSDWSILPCTETIRKSRRHDSSNSAVVAEHFLVPLRLAESVLDFTDCNASNRLLVEAFRMLSLPEVNYAVLSSDLCVLERTLVASIKMPTSILKCLEQQMSTNPQALEGKLTPGECRTILQYFSENVGSLQERDKNTLRRLPFYQATHGGLISLDKENVCVLPSNIPRKEMDEFGRRLNVIFLETRPSLSSLFKFLAFQCVSSIDVYCHFILPHFGILSKDARLAHLEHIRGSILPMRTTDTQRLLDCLRNTPVITSKDGTLKKASSYYEPHNDVFSIMLPDDMFPPEPYNTAAWLQFLKSIGLISKVSADCFKTFATEVAREGAKHRTTITDKKSEVLVMHLFSREGVVEEGLLHAICDIPFVVAETVGKELRDICPQFGEGRDGKTPYIAFKGSLLAEHSKIAWTTAAILPCWANPREYRYQMKAPGWRSTGDYCNAILANLQVLVEPTVDLVTFHCQNVSCQMEKQNGVEQSDDQLLTRASVMWNIYHFLQERAMSNTVAKERLQHIPCVLVEEGGRFVYPRQVVLELYKKSEIRPFLYGMPAEITKFKSLFAYLGCAPSVTPSHYAMVLDMLHGRCKANILNPNEVESALRAVKGLFETMQDNPDVEHDMSTLYMPATYPFSSSFDGSVLAVTLMRANEVIFDDAPHYHGRIQDVNLPFVVDPKTANVVCKGNANYKDLIMLLPTGVRPQMMSCVIKEKFANSQDSSEHFDVGAASSLREQLHSEQFYRGIVRLIRHANQDCGLDETVVATVKSSLQGIEFLGMCKIVTHLVYSGGVIQGSELEVPYFLEKVLDFGQEIWKVYVSAVEDAEETISTIALTLTEVIDDACKLLLRNTTHYISAMLLSQPDKISSLLDKMKIRQDDSYDTDKGDVFPPPGSFIPIKMHNLLNPAFEAFTPGEYVGYESDDPSLELQEGDATFIYAVIIEEVPSGSESLFSKSYKINIGHDKERKIVNATDLYKFHRVLEITSELALSSQQRSSHPPTDKQQIFDEISRALEEAWRLPEDRRRQIVKRLFLRWHPDKNPGNEVLCTEVFQHIKNEIERLEKSALSRGESCRRETWSSDSRTYRGSYSTFYSFWGTRARQYNSQRQEYRESFFRHYGSSGYRTRSWYVPPSFCTMNPQPREAQRWFRQAQADLAAVENDITTVKPSYEWACFKCHQAAEKALKAAQYSVDAHKTNIHNLVQNALMLHDSQLTSLSSQLENRLGDSTRMRYPDQVCSPQIPNDVYSQEMARDALELATRILHQVMSRVL